MIDRELLKKLLSDAESSEKFNKTDQWFFLHLLETTMLQYEKQNGEKMDENTENELVKLLLRIFKHMEDL
jgi:hypothetical protein